MIIWDPIRLLVLINGVEYLFHLTPVSNLLLSWNGNAN